MVTTAWRPTLFEGEFAGDGVDIDLAGFTIGCAEPLTGICTGSASGITVTGGLVEAPRVRNGRIDGMPDAGVWISASSSAVVEDLVGSNLGGNIVGGTNAGGNVCSGSVICP